MISNRTLCVVLLHDLCGGVGGILPKGRVLHTRSATIMASVIKREASVYTA